jgi:uncharacterized protein
MVPDISVHPPRLDDLEVPMDSWTLPFWEATAVRRLLMPRCADCGRFRWPPGPFCPACQSQLVEWCPAGEGRVSSFTIIRQAADGEKPRALVPALIEFPDAGGIRLLAPIVDTPLKSLCIGAKVVLGWSQAANATLPVFRVGSL